MKLGDRTRSGARRPLALAAAAALLSAGAVITGGAAHPPSALAQVVPCPAGTLAVPITWGAGNAVQWPRDAVATTATDLGGSGVDLTITMADPAQRNLDNSNPLATLGDANAGAGQPLFGWDPRIYTETDGAYGPGFMTIGMNSLNIGDTVTFTFDFSYPVLLPDFSIGDIDYSGLGFSAAEEPWNSFQDQVHFTANRLGVPVGVTLTPLGGTQPPITGGTAVGGPYQLGVNGDLAPGDAPGTLRGATDEPVTHFVLAYSNGPDDEAAEAGPSFPPPAILGAPADSVSDSHAVRLNFFTMCVGTGSIGDRVWADVDGDGTQDAGEPGLPGVTVQLVDPDGNVIATTTTDALGNYLFDQLPAFDWTVRVDQSTLPPGVTQTGDPDGALDHATTVTLPPGGEILTADFGYRPPLGTVSGTVFADRDDNGALDPAQGDGGIAGVTVTLTGTDLAGNPVTRTTTTAVDGTYSFTGVPAGTYTVTESQPTGYADGQDTPGTNAAGNGNDSFTVTLPLGGSSTGNDFAELPTGSLAGQVYVDTDNDGVRDGGEAPIPGTTVTLTGTDDAGVAVSVTTTTAADGSYLFDRLRPGTYTVTETQPPGYLDGKDAAGSAGGTVGQDTVTGVTLDLGEAATGYDFGELAAASIAGSVTEDDGTPIPDVTVTLTGTDDLGNPVTATTTTLPDGSWGFPGLRPGTYVVTETQPPGFGDGPDTAGTAGGTPTEPDTITDIVLDPGENATEYVFTEIRSSLAGTVYVDADNDGTQDAGEAGIPGVTVTLTGTTDAGAPVSLTTTTDADGGYVFENLLSGDYTVTETQPPAYLDGQDTAGSAGGTAGQDTVTAIDLPAGTDATGYDFGELPPASVAGRVTEDDGTPIQGVTLTLTGTDDLGNPVTATTTTQEDGSYLFDGLRPGTYVVTETQPPGFGDGPDTAGTAGGTPTEPDTITDIVLDPGENATEYVFTEVRSSLAGTVYVDVDDDGVQNPGEAGIPGVTVTLTGTDAAGNPVSLTTTTDADGGYVFENLLSGDYTITETQPAAYTDGRDTPGSEGGTAVGPDSIELTLPAGTDATGYDFGEIGATIGGTVWLDTDGDGTIDADEPTRLPDVEIVLIDGDGNEVASTTTGDDGTYTFVGLPPGEYTVRETQPDTHGTTTPDEVAVTVPPGGSATADFGEQLGSIGDYVWLDEDADGVQDEGEAGVEGVTVILRDAEGNELDRTTTDADGVYSFVDLELGDYLVTFVLPAGRAFTTPGQGTAATGSDADIVTGTTAVVSVVVADDGTISQRDDLDAGLVPARPDIAVELVVDNPTPGVGDTVTYTGTVTNPGNTPVDGVVYRQTVPAGLTIQSVSGDGWTCQVTGQQIECTNPGIVAPGEVLPPIKVVTRVTQPGVSLTSAASAATLDGQAETTLANNTDAVAIAVRPAPPTPPAPQPRPPLPSTGTPVGIMGLTGLLLLAAGFVLRVAVVRRRSTA